MLQQARGDLERIPVDVGELVRLKGGGPVMTVEEELPDGRVVCVWNGGMAVQREPFSTELLSRYRGIWTRRVWG